MTIPKTFDFDGSQRKLDVKKINDLLFKTRMKGWNTEISHGDDLPGFTPDRFMPIKNIVKADPQVTYGKESGIVINKGQIVAVDSVFSKEWYATGTNDQGIDVSGDVRLGSDVFGNPVKANVEDEGFGYGTTMNGGFLTIANGGAPTTDAYRQVDVDYGTILPTGAAVQTSDTYARSANVPIGIASTNVFVDNKNRDYNFQTQILELNSIKTDYFMIYPYVNTAVYGQVASYGTGYDAIVDDFVFLYGDIADMTISGKYVQSDLNGNFIIQVPGATYDDPKNMQTIGKIALLDNKYPKEKMDEILTYTRVPADPSEAAIGVSGSDTGGIPSHLFIFAWKILNDALAAAPSLGQIQAAISAGDIGYAKINIHVS
jgi:hypothetical protein